MKYVNVKTNEVARLVNTVNIGDGKNIKPRYVFEGEKGRFFVEGKELELWVKV